MSDDKGETQTKVTRTRKEKREKIGGKMTLGGVRTMRKQMEKLVREHVKRAGQLKAAIKLLGKF